VLWLKQQANNTKNKFSSRFQLLATDGEKSTLNMAKRNIERNAPAIFTLKQRQQKNDKSADDDDDDDDSVSPVVGEYLENRVNVVPLDWGSATDIDAVTQRLFHTNGENGNWFISAADVVYSTSGHKPLAQCLARLVALHHLHYLHPPHLNRNDKDDDSSSPEAEVRILMVNEDRGYAHERTFFEEFVGKETFDVRVDRQEETVRVEVGVTWILVMMLAPHARRCITITQTLVAARKSWFAPNYFVQ